MYLQSPSNMPQLRASNTPKKVILCNTSFMKYSNPFFFFHFFSNHKSFAFWFWKTAKSLDKLRLWGRRIHQERLLVKWCCEKANIFFGLRLCHLFQILFRLQFVSSAWKVHENSDMAVCAIQGQKVGVLENF